MGRGRARAKAQRGEWPDDGLSGVREPVTPRPDDLSGGGRRELVADEVSEDRSSSEQERAG